MFLAFLFSIAPLHALDLYKEVPEGGITPQQKRTKYYEKQDSPFMEQGLMREKINLTEISNDLIRQNYPGIDVMQRYSRQLVHPRTCGQKLVLWWKKLWDQPLTTEEIRSAQKFLFFRQYRPIRSNDFSQSTFLSESEGGENFSFLHYSTYE